MDREHGPFTHPSHLCTPCPSCFDMHFPTAMEVQCPTLYYHTTYCTSAGIIISPTYYFWLVSLSSPRKNKQTPEHVNNVWMLLQHHHISNLFSVVDVYSQQGFILHYTTAVFVTEYNFWGYFCLHADDVGAPLALFLKINPAYSVRCKAWCSKRIERQPRFSRVSENVLFSSAIYMPTGMYL